MKTPRLLVFGALAYGLFIFLVLPAGVVALNDDFGYLRSVVATLQHERPWTDDWLEPWAAGLTSLSALLYLGTGSFFFAIYGLLALLAGGSFYVLGRLFVSRGLTESQALGLAALGLTFPTVLWKNVEYTGMALYLPCLLLALWTAERRRWDWFMLCWGLAIATRQSALAWAVLPLAALLEDVVLARARPVLGRVFVPLLAAAAGGGLYGWLGGFMNKTHAQRMITDHMGENFQWARAQGPLTTGAVVLLLSLGLGAAILWLCRRPQGPGRVWPWLAGVGLATAGAVWYFRPPDAFVSFDHAAFDAAFGRTYLRLLLALCLAGCLVLPKFSVRPVALAGALASLAAICARNAVWDYYLLDAAIFGLLALSWRSAADQVPAAPPARGVLLLPWNALLVCGLFHLGFVWHFKARLDRGHALCDLSSRALQDGRLRPDETSFLPFGLMGWYYFPYYRAHEGATSAELADFGRYLKQDTVNIGSDFSKVLHVLPEFRTDPPAERRALIISGRFSLCRVFRAEYFLLRADPAQVRPAKTPFPDDLALPVFPVDDAQWRRLIQGGAKR